VELLEQVYGVGTLIALTYVLTIEDAERFQHSRDVGAFLGLQPKQRESGDRQPQLGISKSGDRLMRSLLVQGAHCILRKGAPDSDLRAWGVGKMETGGKNAKRRAIVAVARKLSVLLHRLWVTGEVYDPLYNRKVAQRAQGKAKATVAA
jgi:transposase